VKPTPPNSSTARDATVSAICDDQYFAIAASFRNGRPPPQPRRVEHQQPRRFDVGGHPRQVELHALKRRDRLPELPPLLHVGQRVRSAAPASPVICAPIPIRPSFSVSIAIL
jgi:hypothetical protein